MADLRFDHRDATKGYITNNLLIPKTSDINPLAVKAVLSFIVGDEPLYSELTGERIGTQPRTLDLWDETKHHLIVPRHFIDPSELPIDWVQQEQNFQEITIPAKMVLWDHQKAALKVMEGLRYGTINMACGRGKTVLALCYIVRRKRPALVIVNAGALMHQWILAIEEYIGKDVRVGVIQADTQEWEGCPITLATVQTLAKNRNKWSKTFREYFGVVVYDECHHMSAPWFVRSADLFYGDRFGLTATATRADGLDPIFKYHLGPITYQYLEQDLVPKTLFHQLDWEPTEQQKRACSVDYGSTTMNHGLYCVFLGTLKWRNEFILDRVEEDIKDGRDILVLAHSVEHTRALYNKWSLSHENAGIINSKDTPNHFGRIPVLKECNPVFATFQLARESLDKPSLDCIHICTSFGSSNDVQQAWGRSQRKQEGKKTPLIHVYEDSGIRMSRNQCGRIRTYLKALQYPIEKERVEVILNG